MTADEIFKKVMATVESLVRDRSNHNEALIEGLERVRDDLEVVIGSLKDDEIRLNV